MTFGGVMEKVKAILFLLYERPWERWELLTIAAGLFVFLMLLVARRRRKARVRTVYAGHVPEMTTVIGTKLAGPNQSGKRVKKPRKGSPAHARKAQKNRRKWSTAAEQPEGSDDPVGQLQCEIIERDQTKARLEREVAELKVAGEEVRQESSQSKQVEERLKVQGAETTAGKEQLQHELVESKQTEKNLKRKVGELAVANEQLRQEITEIRQAGERFKLKVGELTVANEQLLQKADERRKAGPSGRDTRYEDYYRVADGVEQKLCRKCDEWKVRSEFHKNASCKDGLATWCKLCKTKAARKSRQRRTAAKD
ncbi:MAG: hypothetical protein CEE38_18520 [Planctomycetes bacterium B3_Pla]|nr:MAG: hypothetical protein CEE38_18520 [Planctomycetes bacterium B3_Pla]